MERLGSSVKKREGGRAGAAESAQSLRQGRERLEKRRGRMRPTSCPGPVLRAQQPPASAAGFSEGHPGGLPPCCASAERGENPLPSSTGLLPRRRCSAFPLSSFSADSATWLPPARAPLASPRPRAPARSRALCRERLACGPFPPSRPSTRCFVARRAEWRCAPRLLCLLALSLAVCPASSSPLTDRTRPSALLRSPSPSPSPSPSVAYDPPPFSLSSSSSVSSLFTSPPVCARTPSPPPVSWALDVAFSASQRPRSDSSSGSEDQFFSPSQLSRRQSFSCRSPIVGCLNDLPVPRIHPQGAWARLTSSTYSPAFVRSRGSSPQSFSSLLSLSSDGRWPVQHRHVGGAHGSPLSSPPCPSPFGCHFRMPSCHSAGVQVPSPPADAAASSLSSASSLSPRLGRASSELSSSGSLPRAACAPAAHSPRLALLPFSSVFFSRARLVSPSLCKPTSLVHALHRRARLLLHLRDQNELGDLARHSRARSLATLLGAALGAFVIWRGLHALSAFFGKQQRRQQMEEVSLYGHYEAPELTTDAAAALRQTSAAPTLGADQQDTETVFRELQTLADEERKAMKRAAPSGSAAPAALETGERKASVLAAPAKGRRVASAETETPQAEKTAKKAGKDAKGLAKKMSAARKKGARP